MTLSLITPVIAFGRLAQITPSEGPRVTGGDVVALVLVGLILFVALTGFLTLRARPALTRHVHQRRRPLIPSAWGVDRRRIDPDAAAGDSVPPPPAP